MAGIAASTPHARKASQQRSYAIPLAALASALALVWGWRLRQELDLSPEFGLGYALGIVGTGLMVLLLLYSLRKRLRFMRSWGPIRSWFEIHMILGIAGPLAIVFHAKFGLGSLNSTVALACTLLVAGSGLVGRLIYPRIHDGLSGSRLSLAGLRRELGERKGSLGRALAACPELQGVLGGFESFALAEGGGPLAGTWRMAWLGRRRRAARRRALGMTRRALRRQGAHRAVRREVARAVGDYLDAVASVSSFRVWERVFSLWHALHLPLCFLLFGAAAIHVVAVHLY